MGFSNYAAQALLNSLFGKTSAFGTLSNAPTIYVALSTTEPTEAGGNVTEPSGGAYARVATSASTWNAATSADPSVVSNAAEIAFPEATADWASGANLTHFVLYDAASAGNVLGKGALTPARSALSGDTLRFAAGQLTASLD